MRDEVDSEQRGSYVSEMLYELCEEIGIRDAGSPGDARAAVAILRELSASCHHAEEQPFKFDRWVLDSPARLEVGEKELECYPYYGSIGTPEDGARGTLRRPLATDRLPADFDGHVLSDGSQRVLALLAAGVFGPAVPLYQPDLTARGVPVCGVSRSDGAQFDTTSAERAKALLRFSPRSVRDARTSNIVGTIRGSSPDEILFIAHRDTQYTSPGANDNAASLIVMLMLAAYFRKREPAHSLTFLASGAEEIGFLGAFQYARRRAEERSLPRIRLCLDFDSLTYGRHPQIRTRDIPLAESLAARFRMQDSGAIPKIIEEADSLDGAPFTQAGIPTVHLNSRGDDDSKVRLWHRAEDLPSTVDPKNVELSFRAIADFVEHWG